MKIAISKPHGLQCPSGTITRRMKLIIAVSCGVAVVGLGVTLSLLTNVSWGSGHWPQVPDPELFVTAQPKTNDIPGTYLLTRQTITSSGLAIFEGRQCQLDLRPDGSFSVTNYPQWSVESSNEPRVDALISSMGHWQCATINVLYKGRDCWGIVFSGGDARIDSLELRSKGAPYDLMLTYGDGDEGRYMLFPKK